MAKKTNLYSICDVLTREFGPVLEFASDAAAVRAVKNLIKTRPESPIALNPNNFRLYRLGNFDSDSGVISADSFELNYVEVE